MVQLFIDTNIYLNFYEFSNDSLEKLDELGNLIDEKNIKLFLPEQVMDEVNRRREAILKFTLDSLQKSKFTFPKYSIYSDFSEIKKIDEHISELQIILRSLIEKLKKQIQQKSLNADKTIGNLFSKAEHIEINDEIYIKAKRRFNRGNPPGKSGSYGDAINWESLLKSIPEKEDLYFIGADNDFLSPLDKTQFSSFLLDEWHKKKKSKLIYYGLLTEFLKNEIRKIRISKKDIENEKNINVLRAYSPFQMAEMSELAQITVNQLKQGTLFQQIQDFIPYISDMTKQRSPIQDILDLVKKNPEHFFSRNKDINRIMKEYNDNIKKGKGF